MEKRKQLRLKNYDYSQNGYYFITICVQERKSYFINKDVSNMITNTWYKLNEKYPRIVLDQFVVMPDHIHGIIDIVGADPCVRPNSIGLKIGSANGSTLTLGEMIRWFKTMTTNYYIHGI